MDNINVIFLMLLFIFKFLIYLIINHLFFTIILMFLIMMNHFDFRISPSIKRFYKTSLIQNIWLYCLHGLLKYFGRSFIKFQSVREELWKYTTSSFAISKFFIPWTIKSSWALHLRSLGHPGCIRDHHFGECSKSNFTHISF